MTWNKNIIHWQWFWHIGAPSVPNYANSDDSKLEDKYRPRDEYWFRLQNNQDNPLSTKLDYLNLERYLDTSWSWLSYQEVNFNKDDTWTVIIDKWNSAVLNNDWFVTIARSWMYFISAQAQNTKDWEFVVAYLYEWPIGWKRERPDTFTKIELSVASLSKMVYLAKWDILKPLCWTKSSVWLSWTLWFSIVKLW